jgi:type IV secretory pathway ATPase VirB11/archaellum biosynthesis ATPase
VPALDPIRGLLDARTLDPELGALLWLLLEARTPLVVLGRDAGRREMVADALASLLPAAARRVTVAPDDDFEWLPEAIELGWRRERGSGGPAGAAATDRRVSSSDGVLIVRGLADRDRVGGARARIVVRALALGYGLLATMDGDGLDDVLDALHAPAVGTDPDERSRLGVVLGLADDAGTPRVVAAHYVRPVALDTHGHIQRQPPAVLATWNPGADRWDHFAWGVMPDLAGRLGVRPIELEREQARRARILADTAGALA